MIAILPPELLIPIFKNFENDYKTLYKCIRVNRLWLDINIAALWRNPLISTKSIKVLINCMVKEDKDFLKKNEIKFSFELLEKPPLYNYAKFANELNFACIRKLDGLVRAHNNYDGFFLNEKLVKFILDYSMIKIVCTKNIKKPWLISSPSFDICFLNIYELDCNAEFDNRFLEKLTKNSCGCRDIQVMRVKLSRNEADNDILANLISRQKQIKKLMLDSYSIKDKFSNNLNNAILTHSNSIVEYSNQDYNELDHLIPTFNNLKSLYLFNKVKDSNIPIKNVTDILLLEGIYFPNLEKLIVEIHHQNFSFNMISFIGMNGMNLVALSIDGNPNDTAYLGVLIQSISQNCQNLKYLSLLYQNDLNPPLAGVFNNCKKLRFISLKLLSAGTLILDADIIIKVLNATLPRNLDTIIFATRASLYNYDIVQDLMNNWRGPRPVTIKFFGYKKDSKGNLFNGLKKYQDLNIEVRLSAYPNNLFPV